MADTTVLKLKNLTKTYIMGNHKPAKKAQKAIERLHKKLDLMIERSEKEGVSEACAKLDKAQNLFAQEKYLESYKEVTGIELSEPKKLKGVVVHALNGIDFELKKGDLVAIVGPSGSGKSTLLNMLSLLDEPSSGHIFLRDKDITNIRPGRLPNLRSKELGFVFQSFNLIPTLSATENVMLTLKYAGVTKGERKKRAEEMLDLVGLSDRKNHTPNELSGGQRQRVAIARALVNSPAVVFGDELTGELDSKTSKEIMKLIIDLNRKGQTFIIVTHNQEVAAMCKKTVIMRDGKIINGDK